VLHLTNKLVSEIFKGAIDRLLWLRARFLRFLVTKWNLSLGFDRRWSLDDSFRWCL